MSEPIDPREMRKRILQYAYGLAPLSEDLKERRETLHGGSALVSQVLTYASREGFSCEDTMAMLAYHALLSLEQANKRLFDLALATFPSDHPLNTLSKGQA